MTKFPYTTVILASMAIGAITTSGCAEEESDLVKDSISPTARLDIVEALRADMDTVRGAADGGGTVGFRGDPGVATVGVPGHWEFVFEVGPEGIETGGQIFFQAPPFWGWSTPQVMTPDRPGFTSVAALSDDVELRSVTVDQGLLAIEVVGSPLVEGDRLHIRYGDSDLGAMPDHYAERRSCFFFAVDGDGDGVRGLLDDSPCVEVRPGSAARIWMVLPSTTTTGETVEMVIAVLDAAGNRGPRWEGTVELTSPPGVEVTSEVRFGTDDRAIRRVPVRVLDFGTYRISGSTADGAMTANSNPMLARDAVSAIYWADLHGHSYLTDGTGTPADFYRYARDVADLDIAALTDHDHWGMEPLAIHPELWEEIRRETELFHQPGEFVTLLGYEWTSWIHGHRHVLYFTGRGEIYSSVANEFETPSDLWSALEGQQALTFAHHSAGGPIATNWSFPPDPVLEPITEITSVHGSSEALDSPGLIYGPVPGNFVRDVLDRGYRLGFVGSGDSHDGHPGLAHLNSASGGLAAVLADSLDRASILSALRQRRTYATNGPRIVLEATLEDLPMGATVSTLSSSDGLLDLEVAVAGTAPLEKIDIVQGGLGIETIECNLQTECVVHRKIPSDAAEGYLYIRAVQTDGGAAWSSPFFFD